MTSMDNNVIEGDFTVTNEESLMPEVPDSKFHTILEVWREVLKPAATESGNRVTAGWAAKIVNSYSGITFDQMNEFRDRYYAKIAQLVEILHKEISTDRDCLTYDTPELDAEENAQHYKNLLQDWQIAILRWELEWDCTDEYAGVELGCISEVHKMFFGQTGLSQFLDNIKLEYTETDQRELAELLEQVRAEATGE